MALKLDIDILKMDWKQRHLYRPLDLRIVPCVKINKEWCGSDKSFCKLINVWGESCPVCFWVASHFESTLSKLFFHVHRIHPRLLSQSLSRSLPIPRRAIIIFLFIYMFVRVFAVFVVVVVVVVVFFLSFLLLTLTLDLTAGLFLMTWTIIYRLKCNQAMHLSICGLSPHVRESKLRNSGDFCSWNPESWGLESGM